MDVIQIVPKCSHTVVNECSQEILKEVRLLHSCI